MTSSPPDSTASGDVHVSSDSDPFSSAPPSISSSERFLVEVVLAMLKLVSIHLKLELIATKVLLDLFFFPLFWAPLLFSKCHVAPSDRPLPNAAIFHVEGNVLSFVSGGQ